MILFLTSSPTGPLDNSRSVYGVDHKNKLRENLRKYWRENARCLMVSASPADLRANDRICEEICWLFRESGFSCESMDVLDDRTTEITSEQISAYDVVILGGGHVPTQNEFLHRISLRGKLRGFHGLVMGISAGTMNCADVVYAQPELTGEAADPRYARFLPGLGLTNINILPHYQMVKDWLLDGRRLYEDITYGDSYGREFLALPDGSYILVRDGCAEIWGEAYRIADGECSMVCCDGEVRQMPL